MWILLPVSRHGRTFGTLRNGIRRSVVVSIIGRVPKYQGSQQLASIGTLPLGRLLVTNKRTPKMKGERRTIGQSGFFEFFQMSRAGFVICPAVEAKTDYWLPGVGKDCEPWIWRPSNAGLRYLPDNWSLTLGCTRNVAGDRYFYPLNNPGSDRGVDFVANAFVGGLGLLQERNMISSEELFSHRIMFLLFGWGWRRSAFFSREFSGPRDVVVSRGGLDDDLLVAWESAFTHRPYGNDTCIPSAFGTWTLDMLRAAGDIAARGVGIASPTNAEMIHFGLVEVARSAHTVGATLTPRTIVLRATFNIDIDEQLIDKCLAHRAMPHLMRLLEKHKNDSPDKFDKWFWGRRSNIVKQLAKLKTIKPVLNHEEARDFLLSVAFQSFYYVSNTIHQLMQVLGGAIDPPLNEREESAFKHMYMNQPYLGGLSAIVLHPRWRFLMPAMAMVWKDPSNRGNIQVLQRTLILYSEMARERRNADNRRKARKSRPKTETLRDEDDAKYDDE